MSWDFGFLDNLFGMNGGGYPSTQGGPRLDQGFSPVIGWAIGQSFAGAGPVGQYVGMLYSLPREGIPNGDWERQQARRQRGVTSSGVTYVDYGDYIEFSAYETGTTTEFGVVNRAADPAPSQPVGSRTLEVLDRGESGSARPQQPIATVNVFGSPPDRPSWPPDPATFLSPGHYNRQSGQELQFQNWSDPPPKRPTTRTRPTTVRKPSPAGPFDPAPQQPQPEHDTADSGPHVDVGGTPVNVPGSHPRSDVPVPQDFLPWGSWQRPESVPSPRPERGNTGRIETVPTVPVERNFWSRGGTGLAAGAVTAGLGVGALMWWNPVGWVALGTALAIAGGVAATTASAVELSASYGGATSPEQDAQMNRAISATLGYSSPGGVLGSVLGTVWADDPAEGFLQGGLWGGLAEGATSLPGALRALPGLWRAAMPWAKSLLLTPLWFFMSAGGGGGGRSLVRVFAAQGRIASRVRQVEYLGTTPLLEREADWARFQVFGTKTRNEGVFRITYANGQQKIVLADAPLRPGSLDTLEIKYGDMGQMWKPEREAHIIGQANNYLDIARVTGGRAGYLVSTQRGTYRLTQRFGWEFPAEMASGQLWVGWLPWRR